MEALHLEKRPRILSQYLFGHKPNAIDEDLGINLLSCELIIQGPNATQSKKTNANVPPRL